MWWGPAILQLCLLVPLQSGGVLNFRGVTVLMHELIERLCGCGFGFAPAVLELCLLVPLQSGGFDSQLEGVEPKVTRHLPLQPFRVFTSREPA